MSNVARVAGQAANILVKPLNVEDVFSTYLYTGNESTQTITNGIDLDGEGGLVWIKRRNSAERHALIDDRDLNSVLASNENSNARTRTGWMDSFNSDGFTLNTGDTELNNSGDTYASWTFRKAPKFFDIVTYTGDGVSGRTISHNLGCEVGMLVVKRTDSSNDWQVYHRSTGATGYLRLNSTQAFGTDSADWVNTAPTTTEFTVGSAGRVNASGGSYVAYLFAHNDDDGEFGPDGDADIIKCGSFTTDGNSSTGEEIDLGFEPQWILFKATDQTKDWYMFDAMRGIVMGADSGSGDAALKPNSSAAENVNTWGVDLTPTGFKVFTNNIVSSGDCIYIAIRRGPMAVPEDADDVFAMDTTGETSEPYLRSSFPVDMSLLRLNKTGTQDTRVGTRLLQGTRLETNNTDVEATTGAHQFDYMNGWLSGASTDAIAWMWKRAPNYFDVVAYTGNGTSGRKIKHNLTVPPEMMWIKDRGNASNWSVYHSGLNANDDNAPETDVIFLNATSAEADDISYWNDTAPEADVFTLGNQQNVNGSAKNYIAYLFASLDGVSKVGSFTGNGTSQDIDCGFSSGARFVLLKRTDSSGTWFILDTERGIVSGNDAILRPNSTIAENNSYDIIDPLSSGFTINFVDAYNMNTSDATYIFYAIA